MPQHTIIGGNPAKIIRYRFEKNIIDKLLQIKLWEWDEENIFYNSKFLFTIDEFVKKN